MWQAAIAVGDTLAPPNMSKRYYRCPMCQWGVQMGRNGDKKKKKNDEFFFCVRSIYWSMAQKTWIRVLKIKLSLALFNKWVVTVWGEFHVPGKLHMDNQRRKNLTMYSIVCVLMVSTSNIFISIKNCRHQMRIVLVAYLCLGEHERERERGNPHISSQFKTFLRLCKPQL